MTDRDRDGPYTEQDGVGKSPTSEREGSPTSEREGSPTSEREGSAVGGTRQFPTSRRSFVGIIGALTASVGLGSVSGTATAGEVGTSGYGVGGYGEGGFGVGGYRTVEYYADDDGVVRSHGVDEATADWKRSVIDTSLLLEVISAWRSGEAVG